MKAACGGSHCGRILLRLALVAFLIACPAARLAAEYRLYWGDVHTHTNLSDGTGTADQLLTCARDTAQLDFVIITDHDFGNGPPWRMSQAAWDQIQDKADQFTVEGKFVAIAGYEWTSQAKYWTDVGPNKPSERLFPGPPKLYNHKNVYFPARVEHIFSAKDAAYHTPDLLAEAVRERGGLIQNNHPFVFGDNETRDQWQYDPRNSACWSPASVTVTIRGSTTGTCSRGCRRCFPARAKKNFSRCCRTSGSRPENWPFAILSTAVG